MKPEMNIFRLMTDNFRSAPEEVEVQFLGTYILLRTDEEEFLLAENKDIDRCTFIGEVGDEFTFKGPNDEIIPCKKSDYRKTWVAVDVRTVSGTMLNAAYDELTYQIQNQLPPHLKGKIKF